jgi:AAHS family 4-hydroxybenzoate transporter-like MFS transporter
MEYIGTLMKPAIPDIRQFIDEQPLSRYQLLVGLMCGALVFMDGFDAQAMGFVAPALTAQLHITRAALGPVISMGLVGMMAGALVGGPIADRFGRKPVLVSCSFAFGAFTLLTSTATTLESLTLFRLLTGLGLGGAMPNAISLTSEYMPKRLRATAVTTMFAGFSMGAAVGGFVAAALISRYGWQSVFIVGGIFPLLIGVMALVALPESIRFLLLKGGNQTKVALYLSRIAPQGAPYGEVSVGIDEQRSRGFVVSQLFKERRGTVTLLLWVMFFMNLLDLYFLNSWLPTVMNDNGINVRIAIVITTLFQIGGAIGAILLGRLIDRRLSFRILAWTYLSAAACIFLIGEAGSSIGLLVITVFAAGFCVVGGQTSSNALAAEFYPTAMRSTGVGWALGIGRIGSIIGPTLGGILLSRGGGTRQIFWLAAVPVLIATAAAFSAAFVYEKQRRVKAQAA